MWGIRNRPSLAVAAVLVAGSLAACDSEDDGAGGDANGESRLEVVWPDNDVTIGPLVSGTHSILDATFAWTDYVYDDRGPNSDDGDMTDFASAGGDASYPEGESNAADFVQLQISDTDDGLVVRAVLETLVDPSVPLVGVAFDTDDDPATGAETLPGSWTPDGSLGVELLAVLADGAGEVLAYTDDEWQAVSDLEVVVDPERNVVEATVPGDLAAPGDDTWNALGVAGVTTESWLTGAGAIHDLAFVGDEPLYQWQDYRQADILAGKAPAVDATVAVDFAALDNDDAVPGALEPGFHTYLYHSGLTLPEGVRETEDGPEFLGPYQPYLVWIPDEGVEASGPMAVFLHGLTQNHLGSVQVGDEYLGTGRVLSEEIGELSEFVRDGTDFPPHNLTVWPLARGAGLFYEGIAEQDVLDVLADASLRFEPDVDRIILSGASMGGIGTFRIAALYPDLWSVAVPIIGYARPAVEPLLANFENLPILQVNGAIDTLIAAELAQGTTDLLDELELRYRAWMLEGRGHEAGGFVYDCVYRDLPAYVRDSNPARVHYTVDPTQFVVDQATGLDLRHDRAYWVSGIRVADDGALATLDVESEAVERREVDDIVHVDEVFTSDDEGRDLCGPNPEVSTGDRWRERAVEWVFGIDLERRDRLEAELVNVAALTIALDRAGIAPGSAAEIALISEAEVQVTLTGLEPGQEARVGDATAAADADGVATVDVASGAATLSVSAV